MVVLHRFPEIFGRVESGPDEDVDGLRLHERLRPHRPGVIPARCARFTRSEAATRSIGDPWGFRTAPERLDRTGAPLFGFMGELHLRSTVSTVRGFDRSLAVPGDIDGLSGRAGRASPGDGELRWSRRCRLVAVGLVPVDGHGAVCFTLKRPRVQGEERWALG